MPALPSPATTAHAFISACAALRRNSLGVLYPADDSRKLTSNFFGFAYSPLRRTINLEHLDGEQNMPTQVNISLSAGNEDALIGVFGKRVLREGFDIAHVVWGLDSDVLACNGVSLVHIVKARNEINGYNDPFKTGCSAAFQLELVKDNCQVRLRVIFIALFAQQLHAQ